MKAKNNKNNQIKKTDKVPVWNLSDLYPSISSKKLSKDLDFIRKNTKLFERKYHKKIIMGISTYNQSARSAGKKVLYARKLNFPNICVFSYSTFKEKPVYWTLLKRYFK